MIGLLSQMYKTELIKVTDDNFDVISKAAELINRGELVAFPTETVYGLGANGLDVEACKKIYEVKGRPNNKPLSLMVANRDMIESLVVISESANKLINKFLPAEADFPFRNPTVDIPVVVIATTILVAVGIIAGAIPAIRAMKIKPIEALNYEK